MPTPDFVLALRRQVGHAPLPLVGVTAVVVRDDAVLLVRRADTGEWTLVTGIVDPGEEPAAAAVRETEEETTVVVRPVRLASVEALPLTVYANGDQVHYLDHTFECAYVSGDPQVGDDESTDTGWHRLDDLPEMAAAMHERLAAARRSGAPTAFRP